VRDPNRLTRLFIEVPESVRVRVLRDAGLPDDRPGILRGEDGTQEQGLQWVRRNLSKLVGPILRYMDLDDDTVAFLASEGSIAVGTPVSAPAVFSFPFHDGRRHAPADGSLDLAELASSAALLQDLVAALAEASAPFAIPAATPRVRVSVDGAVDYDLACGIFSAGAALVVTAAAAVVPAVHAELSATRPASATVHREAVLAACERYQVPEAYANHLLNRVLPLAARLTAVGVQVELRA
jgi:hypothetical protein